MFTDTWTVGETARLPLQITDADNLPLVPTAVRLYIKPPGEAQTTIANPPADADGQYHHDLDLTKKGVWYYRWEVDAPVTAAVEGAITVQPSRFQT